jgi:RecA-family ATPase
MEKCVLRGEPFLGRQVAKGSVVHYSFDEKARTAKVHYEKLGLTAKDDLILNFGNADSDKTFEHLEEDLLKMKPILCVVDTLFDLVDSSDVNDYGRIKRQLSKFSALAERTKTHIMFIHHQNKPNQNYGRGSGHTVLGSTAIFGGVDTCLIFEQVGESEARSITAVGRAIEKFEGQQLTFDKKNMVYLTSERISPSERMNQIGRARKSADPNRIPDF